MREGEVGTGASLERMEDQLDELHRTHVSIRADEERNLQTTKHSENSSQL